MHGLADPIKPWTTNADARVAHGTTHSGYGTTNADAGVGIGEANGRH